MFYFGDGINKKMLYTVLGIFVVISLINAGTGFWISMVLTIPAVIFAITFHEFAHAWTADKFGDTTPRSQGRLTLNPVSHIDPFGFVLLLFAGIGWGKPVEINPNNFTSNKSRQFCESIISLAGPVMNFLLAIIFTFVYYALEIYAPNTDIINILIIFVQAIITINIGLGVFNLIPLPPLDGEKIFRSVLPYNAIEWLDRNTYTLQMIFMILWIFGALNYIVAPVVGVISTGLFKFVGLIFGLF